MSRLEKVVLKLDNWRIPAGASPNDSSRWPRARARKDLRELGWGTVHEQAKGTRFEHARISVTLRVCRNTRLWAKAPGYRPRDEDNALAALKGFFDGIVSAGVVPDDDAAHLTQVGVTIYAVDRTEDEGIRVEIEQAVRAEARG